MHGRRRHITTICSVYVQLRHFPSSSHIYKYSRLTGACNGGEWCTIEWFNNTNLNCYIQRCSVNTNTISCTHTRAVLNEAELMNMEKRNVKRLICVSVRTCNSSLVLLNVLNCFKLNDEYFNTVRIANRD